MFLLLTSDMDVEKNKTCFYFTHYLAFSLGLGFVKVMIKKRPSSFFADGLFVRLFFVF